MITKIPPNLT